MKKLKGRLTIALLFTSYCGFSQIDIYNDNFSQDAQVGWFTSFEILRGGTQIGAIGTDGVNKLQFFTGSAVNSSTSRLTIDSSGKIGIGIDSPSEKLDVNGSIKLMSSGNKIYWDWPNRTIEQYSSDGTSRMIRFRNSMNSSNPDGGFDFADYDGTSILRINQKRVGIGTTNLTDPNYMLSVNGTIRSKEIKVDANWSDFVFYNDYKLRTLEEVERHINENGHLPEIPSEVEVAENGINLGEMDAKLLQKIEELTLYLIEENKQNQMQEKLIRELQKEVSALKNE